MEILNYTNTSDVDIRQLFVDVFTASEGAAEGEIIGGLVSDLMTKTPSSELYGFAAVDNGKVIGGIFFSKFSLSSGANAFILSPAAVATDRQAEGIGQQLINHGIDCLKADNVELLLTYGDPAYYAKTGFQQIGEDLIKAPYPLSQPVGWLCQSLNDEQIVSVDGATACVEALSNPDYW